MTTRRVALVTGAAGGIGKAIAEAVADRGYTLVLTDAHTQRLADTADELRARGVDVLAMPADVAEYEQIAAVVTATAERHGRIDLLVNNAGIETTGYLWDTPPDTFARVLDVNAKGTLHCLHAALEVMLGQGGEPGRIVNVASLAALASGPTHQSAYNASKHAVLALTECLWLELAEAGSDIAVHVLLPGPVITRIFTDASSGGGDGDQWRATLDAFVTEQGCTPADAAAALMAGIDSGLFWISTHDDLFESFVKRRTDMLIARAEPAATDPARHGTA